MVIALVYANLFLAPMLFLWPGEPRTHGRCGLPRHSHRPGREGHELTSPLQRDLNAVAARIELFDKCLSTVSAVTGGCVL